MALKLINCGQPCICRDRAGCNGKQWHQRAARSGYELMRERFTRTGGSRTPDSSEEGM